MQLVLDDIEDLVDSLFGAIHTGKMLGVRRRVGQQFEFAAVFLFNVQIWHHRAGQRACFRAFEEIGINARITHLAAVERFGKGLAAHHFPAVIVHDDGSVVQVAEHCVIDQTGIGERA